MKKLRIIVLVIVFGLVFTTGAYSDGFGVKGGVNFARITDLELDEGLKSRTGLIIGAFYRFDLGKTIAIQPELFYSMKGVNISYKVSGYGVTTSYDSAVELDYLDIPVLLKFKIPSKGKIRPSIFAGPYVAFKMSAKWRTTISYGEYYEESEEGDMGDEVKGTDFGLTFGVGLDIKMGSGCIVFDARYSLGLSKIPENSDSDSKNSAFSLMLGYAFK